MTNFDCIVVGGGMVGAAAALAVANLGLTVAVVEMQEPKEKRTTEFDLRVSAISIGSEQLLKRLGAWRNIDFSRICPYRRLGVWEQELAYTEFDACNIAQPHLGHIIENHQLQLALWRDLVAHQNITLYCPEQVNALAQTSSSVAVTLSSCELRAKFLLAADGANSNIRSLANIGLTGWQYKQSAMLINVTTQNEQQDITWQQFTDSGPLAFLPLPGPNASLVWYDSSSEVKRLSQLPNEQLTDLVMTTFPDKLGTVNVVNKASFPLTRRHANTYVANRVLLLGDSAHTINPLAGQGVNLGFKDVTAVQTVLTNAISSGLAFDTPSVFKAYELLRRKDNLMMMSGMDFLYNTFSSKSVLLKPLRNLGLFTANRAPLLKEKALKYACGLS